MHNNRLWSDLVHFTPFFFKSCRHKQNWGKRLILELKRKLTLQTHLASNKYFQLVCKKKKKQRKCNLTSVLVCINLWCVRIKRSRQDIKAHGELNLCLDMKRYRSRKSKASRFVKLSHTALKTKVGVGKVKHELLHLIVQENQVKTLPLTFLTGIHAKRQRYEILVLSWRNAAENSG